MKRILVISPWESRWSLGEGAGVSDDYNFIRSLTKSGFELHFLVPRSRSSGELPFDHFHTHPYPNFFAPTRRLPTSVKRLLWPVLFNLVVTVRALLVARATRPDFILGHSHYGSFPAYVTRELLRIPSGVKLFGVMDLVNTDWPRGRYLFKNFEQILALKVPQDVWIILDDGTKGREAALRHGVPEAKIRFLPNGINLEWMEASYDRAAVRRELEVEDDARVVLFLARLVASKRPELFVQAAPLVARRAKRPVAFIVAGDGPERSACRTLARALGVGDRVHFIGKVPHERVPAIMHASDVFVSTSRLTNMAIPTCEALVCGLPVAALDVGDTREVIRDGENGLVVPDDNLDALADAITRLTDDDVLRAQMRTRAREFARDHFTSWDERTAMEIDVINETIASSRLR